MRTPTKANNDPEKALSIAVIGGTGRMGAMLVQAWREAGHDAYGLECLPGRGVDGPALARADVVMLAVPVSVLCETLERAVPHMHAGQLLMDVTSVKTLPMLIMQELFSGPVVGSHPLFGPAPNPEDLRTVLVAGHHAEFRHQRMAEALFHSMGASVIWAKAQEHDHGVAFAQSLNFAMSAAFFSTIARHRECLPFLTPSFKRHMQAARRHLTRDRRMFCEFSAHNPCLAEAVDAYRTTLEEALADLEGVSAEAAVWFAEDGGSCPGLPDADGLPEPAQLKEEGAAGAVA